MEHIVYESVPRFFVTSSLYIPSGMKRNEKTPVILYCSGHTAAGYRTKAYQHVIINLVMKGFIVFAFDPVGQGERLEYFDPETGKSIIGGPTKEHSYPGAQAFIAGGSQAHYMTWDGIRAVDYLLTRKEVDPARIGITGRSGGGPQSAYIAAMDERIYAAAPECYITNFTRLLQSIGPQDAEQNLLHGIARGIDHPDFLLVRAPKPALMVTTTNDFFSIQGARETAKQIEEIYRVYEKPGNFNMTEDFAIHESTRKNREAMDAFFRHHLNNPGSSADEEVEFLSEAEMQVTATGQVSTALQGETVFSLNRRRAEKLQADLQKSRGNLKYHLSEILESATKLSGYHEPSNVDVPVFAGSLIREGKRIDKYFMMGEGNYPMPYLLYLPEKPNNRALIYIHPSGKHCDSTDLACAGWFTRQGYTVLVPDLIGTGETFPADYRGDSKIAGSSFNIWYASILTGRSIAGIRAGDVVRLVRILENTPGINEIYALAKGNMSPVLLHAAAFCSSIRKVALLEPLSSYYSIVTNRNYSSLYIHNAVAGALQEYDLPDLAASLAPRPLLMVNVTDGTGKMPDQKDIEVDLSVIRASYRLTEWSRTKFKDPEN